MRRRLLFSDGQATIEWLGIVLLVAAGLSATSLLGHEFFARAISRQFMRAICIVSGGDCHRDQEVCTVRERYGGRSLGAKGDIKLRIASVNFQLGRDKTVFWEKQSDGMLMVTVVNASQADIGAKLGLGKIEKLKKLSSLITAELAASAMAAHGGGRSWLVRNEREAMDLLKRVKYPTALLPKKLRQLISADYQVPVKTYGEMSREIAVNGTTGRVKVGQGNSVELEGGVNVARTTGASVDRRTGHRTIYIEGTFDAQATLLAGDGDKDTELVSTSTSKGHNERYAIEFDAQGRPLDLKIELRTSSLPAVASSFANMLKGRGSGNSVYVTTGHLDLTDPVNLAATQTVIDSHGKVGIGPPSEAVRRLRTLVENSGTIEVEVLREQTPKSSKSERSLSHPRGKLGALRKKIAGDVSVSYERSSGGAELVAAGSRGLDRKWLPRGDCVAYKLP